MMAGSPTAQPPVAGVPREVVGQDATGPSGARGIVTQVPGGWQATMRIPLRELAGAKPLVNSRWRLGLGRYDLHPRRGPVLTHAAPLTQCDFHRHEEWIPIRFAR